MKLAFGKHKGEDIVDIDLSYLQWLEQQDWLRADHRERVQFEIQRRSGDRPGAGRVVNPRDKQ